MARRVGLKGFWGIKKEMTEENNLTRLTKCDDSLSIAFHSLSNTEFLKSLGYSQFKLS